MNWNELLNPNTMNYFSGFANGQWSGRQLYALFANTPYGGGVRGLLRNNGVEKARELTKRALQRRGVSLGAK